MYFITFMFSFAFSFLQRQWRELFGRLAICSNALIFLFRVLSSPILIFLLHFLGEILDACSMILLNFYILQ